jgi:hypothetical protein
MTRPARTIQRPTTPTRTARVAALVVVVALLAAACTDAPPPAPTRERPQGAPAISLPDGLVLAGALTSFDACDDFLDYVQQRALEIVTPYGLGGGGWRGGDVEAVDDGAEMDAAAGDEQAGPAPTAGEDFSGTNVQEAAVDEPDRLKTDGRTMYVVRRGHLEVVDVTGDQPRSLATVGSVTPGRTADAARRPAAGHLLQRLVIPFAGEASPPGLVTASTTTRRTWGTGTTLTSIDVSDPSVPVVVERLTLDGWVGELRMVDGVVRVVVRTEAGINLPWEYPRVGGLRAEQRALEANRELIRASHAEDWLPYYVHQTADGRDEGILLACNRIARPGRSPGSACCRC